MFDSWSSNSFSASPSSTTSGLTSSSVSDECVNNMSSPPSFHSVPSPVTDESRTLLSISTTFYPGAPDVQDSDLVLASSDGVFFFVHRARLLDGSSNSFGGLLPPVPLNHKVDDTMIPMLSGSPLADDTSIHDPTIDLHSISSANDNEFPPSDPNSQSPEVIVVPEPAALLNIILLIVYGLSMERYQPDLQLLCRVLPALTSYGYQPRGLVTSHSEIFYLLLAHSKMYPLVVYALAASYNLEQLAISCSQNTLGVELSEITDDLAAVMGPIYLRKLFFLHLGRTAALKRILLEPPGGHPPSETCDLDNQKSVPRAWALAVAYIAVEGRPDTHPTMLSTNLSTLGDHLACADCRAILATRVQSVVQQWSAVSLTI